WYAPRGRLQAKHEIRPWLNPWEPYRPPPKWPPRDMASLDPAVAAKADIAIARTVNFFIVFMALSPVSGRAVIASSPSSSGAMDDGVVLAVTIRSIAGERAKRVRRVG